MSTFEIKLLSLSCLLWCATGIVSATAQGSPSIAAVEPAGQIRVQRVAVPDPFGAPVEPAVPADQPQDEEPQEGDAKPEDEDTSTPKKNEEPLDPQLIQFELWDGSQIVGKIEAQSIGISTEFGMLEVPIGKIRRVLPGYGSYPVLRDEISKLVEQLDDKDFDIREAAQRSLVEKGLILQNILANQDDGGSAERKKRLAEIQKEFEEMVEELEESFETDVSRGLIEDDTIETDSFSIVGKIQKADFKLRTKFGDLSVSLADIKSGDRTVFQRGNVVEKSFTVKGDAFYQRKPVVTRIRVEKGDRITIRGSGTVNWTNWSTVSSPTGLPNQGQYNGIPAGALTARVGSSGKVTLIGDKKSFVATTGGTLYLAVAMPDNYVNESSYRWTGSFRAKVKVEPAQ